MGFSYTEFLDLTWLEFDFYSVGYQRRIEREWDYTRHIIASSYNSSGFSKKQVKADEVMKLPHLDMITEKAFEPMRQTRLESMLNTLNKE